ncbi:MAG: collagen-like protein [Reinekea sp.]
MTTKTLFPITLLFCIHAHAAVVDDPCEGAEERFSCLQSLIDQEQQLIAARIHYLNTTPGPKGETGPQGVPGAQGEKGNDGYDVYGDFQGFIDRWMDQLDEISLAYRKDVAHVRYPLGLNGYFAGDLRVRLGQSHLKLSNINRNPALIGRKTYNKVIPTNDYTKLFFPEKVAGTDVDPRTGYVYSANGADFYRVYKDSNGIQVENSNDQNDILTGTFTANICDDKVLSIVPSYCNEVVDIDEMQQLTNDPTMDIVVSSCTSNCGMHFGVAGEVAAYEVKLATSNPFYQLALTEYLDFLEANRNALIADMRQSINEESTKISALTTQISTETNSATKADLQDQLDASRLIYSGLQNGVTAVKFFADPTNDSRALRLTVLSANNDVLDMNIMTVLSTLYYRYIHGQLTVTPEQMAALDDFHAEMQKYYRNFIERWQNKAELMRMNYFATHSSFSLAAMFAKSATPDFAEEARAELEGEVYSDQSPALQQMLELAAVSATATAVPVSGLALSSAVLTASSTVGDLLAGVSLLTEGTVSFGAGAAGAASGPAAIIAIAVIIGIEGGIQAFEQGGKDDRYYALIDASPGDFSVLDLSESELATLIYMALLVD